VARTKHSQIAASIERRSWTEVHKALAEATPPDALKNMPIGRIEEAQAMALKKLGFIDILPDIKCKVVCKFVYPPGKVECTLECTIDF
jgi:hypothetical protein